MRRGTLVSPITVGREEETQQLLLELEDARLRRGRLTVVVGEAGVGKTRLISDLERVASGRGMLVLHGAAFDSGAPIPYRLIASAVLPAFRRGGPPDDPALGPYRGALSLLVPEWGDASRAVSENSGLAVLEASGRLLGVLAGTAGLLLVLEDIHWADAESLAVLEYLADTLGSERVLCVATCRPAGEAGGARPLLDRCASRETASLITLIRLAPAAAMAQLVAILGTRQIPDGLAEFMTTNAEGLPLAAEELLAELIAEDRLVKGDGGWTYAARDEVRTPSGFQRLVERRLARLRPSTVQALKAASLLGREFDWTLIAPIAGLTDGEVLGALAESVDAQLLESTAEPGRMQFRHALQGACVAACLLPPERARLARAAASAVEAGASTSPERLELAASLWLQAGEPEAACRLLMRLGADALGRGAVSSAVTILERALSVSPDGTESHVAVLELLSDALSHAGRMDRCLEVTAALPAQLRRAGSSADRIHAGWIRLARAEMGAGVVAAFGGLPRDSRHWTAASRALELADATDESPRARASTTAVRARLAVETAEFEEAVRLSNEALSLAERTGASDAACEALYVHARAVRGVAPDVAAAALERALSIVDRDGVERWRLRLLVELGLVDRATSGRADRLLAARDLARECGEVHTAAVASVNLGFASEAAAPPWTMAEADAALADAVDLSRRHHLPVLGTALRFRSMNAAMQGDGPAFDRDLADLRTIHRGREALLSDLLFWRALFSEDRALVMQQLPVMATMVAYREAATAPFRGFYALFCAVAGCDGDAAVRLVTETGYGSSYNRALTEVAHSVLLGHAGDSEEATRRHAAALPLVRSDVLLHMAQRLVAEAAIRDAWGAPAEWLRAAHAFFETSGIHHPARACAALLRSIGEPVARRGRGDAAVPPELHARGVTSREMDVLLLVRDGLSNTEIAERLFMSRRTVETHVSHLLAKLAVASRGRLAAHR